MSADSDNRIYCSWEGHPTIIVNDSHAYTWMSNLWAKVDVAEVAHEGRVMSKSDFEARFPASRGCPAARPSNDPTGLDVDAICYPRELWE